MDEYTNHRSAEAYSIVEFLRAKLIHKTVPSKADDYILHALGVKWEGDMR